MANVGFIVLTTAFLKFQVVWGVTLCELEYGYWS